MMDTEKMRLSRTHRTILQPLSGKDIKKQHTYIESTDSHSIRTNQRRNSVKSQSNIVKQLNDSDFRKNIKREKLNIDDDKTLLLSEDRHNTSNFEETLLSWGLGLYTNAFLQSGFISVDELLGKQLIYIIRFR